MNAEMIRPGLLRGAVEAPPSKSCHHRLLIAEWLALPRSPGEGRRSRLGVPPAEAREEARESADIAATRRCLAALEPVSMPSSPPAPHPHHGDARQGAVRLDVGESGSTLRFLLPLATLAVPEAIFYAEGRLPQRPIQPFLDLLSEHGLEFPNGAAFPLHVRGALRPGVFHVPGNISSQIITGLLFALPALDGASEIRLTSPLESRGYIDLTLDVLAQCGIRVETLPADAGWRVPGGQRWHSPRHFPSKMGAVSEVPPLVEGDWSGAAFWLVAGALGSNVAVSGLRPDSAQPDRAIAAILRRMGAEVRADVGDDGLATVRAIAPKDGLRACEIDVSQCPDLLPALAVAAARAHGATRFIRAARLRLKESDRIAAMEAVLARFGVETKSTPDTLTVQGVPDAPLHGGAEIPVAGDHRIAMAAAVAATVADAPIVLPGAECVAKSYPAFFDILHHIQPAP